MGSSVQAANPNTYERPVTPPSVSRSISTRAAVGMAPLALAGGRLNGTSTGRAAADLQASVIDVLGEVLGRADLTDGLVTVPIRVPRPAVARAGLSHFA